MAFWKNSLKLCHGILKEFIEIHWIVQYYMEFKICHGILKEFIETLPWHFERIHWNPLNCTVLHGVQNLSWHFERIHWNFVMSFWKNSLKCIELYSITWSLKFAMANFELHVILYNSMDFNGILKEFIEISLLHAHLLYAQITHHLFLMFKSSDIINLFLVYLYFCCDFMNAMYLLQYITRLHSGCVVRNWGSD